MKEITSKDHPLVKHFTKLRINRGFRYEMRRVVVEGEKLVYDVLKQLPYHHLLVLDREAVPPSFDPAHVCFVTEEIMKKISGMQHPPRMMAEFEMPSESSLKGLNWVLALDRLQDPGNLGTLFRTALALGWQGIFLIDDTVDPYNDKALRASVGSTLLLPWRAGTHKEFEAWAEKESLPVFIADLKGSPPEVQEKGCLVLGQEGGGVQKLLKERYSVFTIPLHNSVESLNVAVAGGILMHTMRPS